MLLVAEGVRSSDREAVARSVAGAPSVAEAPLVVADHSVVEEALAGEESRITTPGLAAAVGSRDYWRSSESVAPGR